MRTPAADCTIWERLKTVSWVKSSAFSIATPTGVRALKRSFFEGARRGPTSFELLVKVVKGRGV